MILVVYNICGIRSTENIDYYIRAIQSILAQDFDRFDVVVSGCMSNSGTKEILESLFR